MVPVARVRPWRRVKPLMGVLLLAGCMRPESAPRYARAEALSDAWRTKAERTEYVETDRYLAVVDFCRRLAEFSPSAQYQTFGESSLGRPLPLLVLSRHGQFSPPAAGAHARPVVLLQNAIHAGECEGKDASLELARDILVTGERAELLEHVDVLIMPIFNVDGHERFGPYNRINQNGPRETGWRTTAADLNLNREYVKADAVEMQGWLRVWTTWCPDLLIDNHSTDGADFQYDLLYAASNEPMTAASVAGWVNESLYPAILPQLADDGHLTFPYCYFRDERDPAKGVGVMGSSTPRYSTGYGAVCNRPSILVETHMLKPYGQRVRCHYDLMLHTLEELNRNPERLLAAVWDADQAAIHARGADVPGGAVALDERASENGRPITFRGFRHEVYDSPITGGEIVRYTQEPVDFDTQIFDEFTATQSVRPPLAYLIPPQWTGVIARLEWHGLWLGRLREARTMPIEQYRFTNVRFAARPFQGRHAPQFETETVTTDCEFPAGTVVVDLTQPRARLAVHLLEPAAPDSLLRWGFFNVIFERREYAEAYVMEPLAQRMLAEEEGLRAEFEQRLLGDADFAKSPGARLDFFYQRSPYSDATWNVYPVGRLVDEAAAAPILVEACGLEKDR